VLQPPLAAATAACATCCRTAPRWPRAPSPCSSRPPPTRAQAAAASQQDAAGVLVLLGSCNGGGVQPQHVKPDSLGVLPACLPACRGCRDGSGLKRRLGSADLGNAGDLVSGYIAGHGGPLCECVSQQGCWDVCTHRS
jgi:hypothetical protein